MDNNSGQGRSDAFKRVPRRWVAWGIVASVVLALGIYAALFIALFENSEAYKMGVARLVGNSEAIRTLGAPITAGFPWGTIKVSGPDGYARFQFSAVGPNADGTVYLAATKEFGTWKINRLELEVKGRESRIFLDSGPKAIRTVPVH